ncbi:MAG: M3 family metallopeptidase [Deltaproteobacteria bacterium]|nr:M3 family metallopeptidase [Deltaproteobacteria bacterium]
MKRHAPAIVLIISLAGCGPATPQATPTPKPEVSVSNPLLTASALPLHYPPFDAIRDEHFGPAFDRGMAEHRREIAAIAGSPEPPTFENTMVALERSGQLLTRATTIFFSLLGADQNDARKALQTAYAAKFAAHRDAIVLDAALFARIDKLHAQRASLGLDAESLRLVERTHLSFVRAGAKLAEADKRRLEAMNAELAKLSTAFGQKVLAEVNDSAVVVDDVKQLEGLSPAQIATAAEAAKARGLKDKWVLALTNTSGQPPNGSLRDRALRERIYRASMARGSHGGPHDTTAIVARVVRLRAERARLLGYPSHAAYVLADETAQTPEAALGLLTKLAPVAVANARREAADIAKVIRKEGGSFEPQAWDWEFYAGKVRRERFAFDESELRPYLELDRVLRDGVFFAATRLYGITFKERKDLPVYHPDVRVFDVFEADGSQLAIFIFDPYARPSKRGGAWMNAYVPQSHLLGTKPVVANHLNIPKPPAGQPTLMTWDEVETAFHEFGHALHGMFSNVRYPRFAGTSVPRDFVEFPSQVNEMWAVWPEVLASYARHFESGEAIPKALLDKVLAAQQFNQGFMTTEYLAAALIDQRWHALSPDEVPEPAGVMAFEAAALAKDGLDFAPVPPRYRTPYFSHIMGGYAAAYYAYLWSEVLDADTVEWFKRQGGLTRKNGDRFRAALLSRGGSVEPMKLVRDLLGREPQLQPLLERRGLAGAN